MFRIAVLIGLGALIILDSINFATTLDLKRRLSKMALDLTSLKAAEEAHNTAIQQVSDRIDALLLQLGTTDPNDQAAIDALTKDIQDHTAILVAAATKSSTPTA